MSIANLRTLDLQTVACGIRLVSSDPTQLRVANELDKLSTLGDTEAKYLQALADQV